MRPAPLLGLLLWAPLLWAPPPPVRGLRHGVHWNGSNPRFLRDDYTIQVSINDYLDIYCPHYEGAAPAGRAETFTLFMVDREGYRGCYETPGAFKRWECNQPYAPFRPVRFSEKIQRFTPFSLGFEFQPGETYYYICERPGGPARGALEALGGSGYPRGLGSWRVHVHGGVWRQQGSGCTGGSGQTEGPCAWGGVWRQQGPGCTEGSGQTEGPCAWGGVWRHQGPGCTGGVPGSLRSGELDEPGVRVSWGLDAPGAGGGGSPGTPGSGCPEGPGPAAPSPLQCAGQPGGGAPGPALGRRCGRAEPGQPSPGQLGAAVARPALTRRPRPSCPQPRERRAVPEAASLRLLQGHDPEAGDGGSQFSASWARGAGGRGAARAQRGPGLAPAPRPVPGCRAPRPAPDLTPWRLRAGHGLPSRHPGPLQTFFSHHRPTERLSPARGAAPGP